MAQIMESFDNIFIKRMITNELNKTITLYLYDFHFIKIYLLLIILL
jgi:hypothetical protein